MPISSNSKQRVKWGGLVDLTLGSVPSFFSDLFPAQAGWLSEKDKISVDVVKLGNQAAQPQQKGGKGNDNSFNVFSNIEVSPPEYHESYIISQHDLEQRAPGELALDDDEDPNRLDRRLVVEISRRNSFLLSKFRRGIEIQGIEVFTTGTFTAKDDTYSWNDDSAFFPTVGTPWSTHASADPLGDLRGLMDLIRQRSGRNVSDVVMGRLAFYHFMQNEDVKELFLRTQPNTFIEIQNNPTQDDGSQFIGQVTIGHNRVNVRVYDPLYTDEAGDTVEMFDPWKVALFARGARRERRATSMRKLLPTNNSLVRQYSPGMINAGNWAYFQTARDLGEEAMKVDMKTRMLLHPWEKYSWGSLTVGS